MKATKKSLRLRLEFTGNKVPHLSQTAFSPLAPEPETSTKVFICRPGRGKNKFEWRPGPMALCYCLLEYVIWSKLEQHPAHGGFIMQGGRNHPVKTLDNGMGQSLNWMEDMFGCSMGTTDCRLHEYISRINPDQASKGRPYELQFRTDVFPAAAISIFWDGAEVTELKSLDKLAGLIAHQWHEKTKNLKTWKSFLNGRKQTEVVVNEKPMPAKIEKKVAAPIPPTSIAVEEAERTLVPTSDTQREWPDDRLIDKSFFFPQIIGKEPRVYKSALVQFRGRFIKGYLHASCPNTSPPDYYQQQDWLDEDCSVILSNHLLKERPEHVLGLFQHDELGLDDWAKERIAKAIWQNLAWRKKLPNEVSGSDRLWQIWQQECERHFPEDARLTIRQKCETRLNGDGAHSTME